LGLSRFRPDQFGQELSSRAQIVLEVLKSLWHRTGDRQPVAVHDT
jgi:2,4-dienoyl-CoA reductase-like NADH-dependent reductase (Old Yellow Enzyme family)